MKKNNQTKPALGMAAAFVPTQGDRGEWPNSRDRQQSPATGCLKEQAEKLPKKLHLSSKQTFHGHMLVLANYLLGKKKSHSVSF